MVNLPVRCSEFLLGECLIVSLFLYITKFGKQAAGINGDEHAHADSNSKMLVKLKEENRTLRGRWV